MEPDNDGPEGKLFGFPDLFREVADALQRKEYWREALQFYDPLQLVEEYMDPSYFSDMASCYEALGMYDDAEYCLRVIIKNDEGNMAAWLQMATMFDGADMLDRAAPYVDRVIAMKRVQALERKQAQSASQPSLLPGTKQSGEPDSVPTEDFPQFSSMLDSTPVQRPIARRTKRQNEKAEMEKKVQSTYLEMRRLRERLRLGEPGAKALWMEGAKFLIELIKKNKTYFPMDRSTVINGLSRKERKAKGVQWTDEVGTRHGRLHNLLGMESLKLHDLWFG